MTNLPIEGEFNITATYGQKGPYWADGHKGIDFTAKNKTIYATCDGTVRVVAYDEIGWGQYVSIGDANGNRHIFCHLAKGSVKVKDGQKVTRSTIIGTMGSTGNSTGVHLHFQMNDKNNAPMNPCKYLGVPNKKGSYNSKDFQIGEDNMKFKDDAKISSWAKEDVKKVSDAGIMVGDAKGNFNPKAYLTREEAAVIIARAKKL